MHGCTPFFSTEVIGQAGDHMTWISPRQAAAEAEAEAAALESQRDADTAHLNSNPQLKEALHYPPEKKANTWGKKRKKDEYIKSLLGILACLFPHNKDTHVLNTLNYMFCIKS